MRTGTINIVAGLLDNLGIELQDRIENIVEDATDIFAAVLRSILYDTIGCILTSDLQEYRELFLNTYLYALWIEGDHVRSPIAKGEGCFEWHTKNIDDTLAVPGR